MKSSQFIYFIYTFFIFLFVLSIFLVPFLAFDHDVQGAYNVFSYTCHQKLSRSECLFRDGLSVWIEDCTPQGGKYVSGNSDSKIVIVKNSAELTGYKLPVCARDIGIYVGLLLGAILYSLVRDLDDKTPFHPIFLLLAIVPLGLDGTIQLLSETGALPFLYESTNLIRLATGLLAGGVASFFIIPMLVGMFSQCESNPKTNESKSVAIKEKQA